MTRTTADIVFSLILARECIAACDATLASVEGIERFKEAQIKRRNALEFELMNSMSHRKFCKLMGY